MARAEAEQRRANRTRREQLLAHDRALVAALTSLRATRGPVAFVSVDDEERPTSQHADLVYELQMERMRTSCELRWLIDGYSAECGYGADVEAETEIVLLEHGASSYQIGALDTRASAVDAAARKRADRAKRTRATEIEAQLAALPSTSGDIVTASGMRIAGPQPWESRRADLEARRDRLALDRRSSSRKRKTKRG